MSAHTDSMGGIDIGIAWTSIQQNMFWLWSISKFYSINQLIDDIYWNFIKQ